MKNKMEAKKPKVKRKYNTFLQFMQPIDILLANGKFIKSWIVNTDHYRYKKDDGRSVNYVADCSKAYLSKKDVQKNKDEIAKQMIAKYEILETTIVSVVEKFDEDKNIRMIQIETRNANYMPYEQLEEECKKVLAKKNLTLKKVENVGILGNATIKLKVSSKKQLTEKEEKLLSDMLEEILEERLGAEFIVKF